MGNYKNRYLKLVLLFIILIIYLQFSTINDSNELTELDSITVKQLPTIPSCSSTDSCDKDIKQPEIIDPLVIMPPALVEEPITIIPPVKVKDSISLIEPLDIMPAVKPPTVIKLQGKEILKESTFSTEDLHQCRIEFDKQSVLKVNNILEQFSYEIDLNKTSYEINKQLTLHIISPVLADQFNEILIYKIQTLLQIYRQSFGLNLHKKSEINLVILPSQETYEDFISNLSLNNSNTLGLFWARSNYAFVAFNNDQQAGQTAFHEAVHAINFSLVGMQSRWSNEGVAELFENMKVTQDNGNYMVSIKLPSVNNQLQPMGYQELVYAEDQWWDFNQVEHLYSSSFTFLSYLFTHKAGRDLISNLLIAESKNPCSTLPMDDYFQVVDENLWQLPISFDEWLAGAI
ncbi:MAG: hypothetical protein GY951_06860 [Psychromonas sp.]|nr:hypothetical protein [Psychromonas sp.]